MTGDPEPFTSLDDDVRCLDGFLLNVERLLASETVAIGNPSQCWAALMLWCRAWKQVPGGSLPNDERVLAAFSGAGARWKSVRDIALRGFILCSDGRLYHKVLCEEVKRAAKAKRSYETRRTVDQKRLVKWRQQQRETAGETHDETDVETVGETRFVALETRREEIEREGKKESPPSPPLGDEPKPTAAKANSHERRKARTGIPVDWRPSERDRRYAHNAGYDDGWIEREAVHFLNHHTANGNIFANHAAAWATWVDRAAGFAPRNGSGKRPGGDRPEPPSLLRAAAIALGKAGLEHQ